MAVRIGVSLDLLGTLVEVYPSTGYQSAIDMNRFLQKKSLREVPMNVGVLERNFVRAFKTEVSKDRAKWVAQGLGEASEMPIGGLTKESVADLWCRIVNATYDRNGDFCNHDATVMSVIQEVRDTSEWKRFLQGIVDRYATPDPYGWLPEALPTLRWLKQWRETQMPPNIQCDPPAIVTNSDHRSLTMVRAMVERDGDAALLGPVLTADVIGAGKPSPKGILLAAKASGVLSLRHWIHVGDAEEDRVAAERAGCHFCLCSKTQGPVWSELRAKLEEACNSAVGLLRYA
ncbi:hypothetical protein DQ04_00941130 [Trypanosoma grayi]|uniref:hypothetical protein n=1 Tax=Trypanosoma grayi TaxID=71804 RepID=UPI0004F46A70|nr:hypothetical protein DQ04_00941130 [Trypanosoma grayi]KEG13549.1 hypothetical protein DQ04_00941130 [Trypanosoma grayi]